MSVTIRPGAMRLADWRTIWRGAAVVLDRAADDAIAASAAAVARILGRHEPVYGINTGFGKLRSEEHTSELQSLMRISYAVLCLKKKKHKNTKTMIKNNHNTNRNQ